VEQDPALGARGRNLLVHAVDAAHERRLAAARGADDRGHGPRLEAEAHVPDGLRPAIPGAQPLELHAVSGASLANRLAPLGRRARARGRDRLVGRAPSPAGEVGRVEGLRSVAHLPLLAFACRQRADPSRLRPRAESARAITLTRRTKSIKTRAAPQACACLTGSGDSE